MSYDIPDKKYFPKPVMFVRTWEQDCVDYLLNRSDPIRLAFSVVHGWNGELPPDLNLPRNYPFLSEVSINGNGRKLKCTLDCLMTGKVPISHLSLQVTPKCIMRQCNLAKIPKLRSLFVYSMPADCVVNLADSNIEELRITEFAKSTQGKFPSLPKTLSRFKVFRMNDVELISFKNCANLIDVVIYNSAKLTKIEFPRVNSGIALAMKSNGMEIFANSDMRWIRKFVSIKYRPFKTVESCKSLFVNANEIRLIDSFGPF